MAKDSNREILFLAVGIIGVLIYYNQDYLKQKYQCVANCYTSSGGSGYKVGASTTTMGASGTTMTPVSHFDGSVAQAQAQMAASASGLGQTTQITGRQTAMYGLGDPMAGNSEGLAAFQPENDATTAAALNNVVAPLTQQQNAESLAWVAAQSQQSGASLLPTNVSAENAALLNTANFLAAGDVGGGAMLTRPVHRNDGSGSQDFLRPQILVAPDPTVGGGFNMSVADPIIRPRNLY